jgi:hypothetical protein
MPVPKKPVTIKDNPWQDIPGKIVHRQVNPWQEGTPQSFGGTTGSVLAPDPATLPNPPEVPVNSENKNNTNSLNVPDVSNVLNRKTMFSVSDYERIMLMKEGEKLQGLSKSANEELKKTAESQRFFHLSLSKIAENTVLCIVAIFVDILNFFTNKNEREEMTKMESINTFFMIFLKEERLIYFGVFLVLLSMLFMVVFLSS